MKVFTGEVSDVDSEGNYIYTQVTDYTTDENGNDVYNVFVDSTTTNLNVKVEASATAMISGDYTSVGAATPQAENPLDRSPRVLENKYLPDEMTSFEFKVRAEDADEYTYKKLYVNVYKKNSDTELERIDIGYERNGVQGSVKAVQDPADDKHYIAYISSSDAEPVSPIEIKATAKSTGATVKIDDQNDPSHTGSLHIDTVTGQQTATGININVTPTDGSAADYKLDVIPYDFELKRVTADGADVIAEISELVDGRAADIYEIFVDDIQTFMDLEVETHSAAAGVTVSTLPDEAANPSAPLSTLWTNHAFELDKEGYTELQVKVGDGVIPSEFNNIAYIRIYEKSDNNELDYIDVTYAEDGQDGRQEDPAERIEVVSFCGGFRRFVLFGIHIRKVFLPDVLSDVFESFR